MQHDQTMSTTAYRIPDHVDPAQWIQAIGVSRQACARIFRDGGRPVDALRAFGLSPQATGADDWRKAVGLIAETLCSSRARLAA